MEYVKVYRLVEDLETYTGSYKEFVHYNLDISRVSKFDSSEGKFNYQEEACIHYREPVVRFCYNKGSFRGETHTTEKYVVMSPEVREILEYKSIGDDNHKFLISECNRFTTTIAKLQGSISKLEAEVVKVSTASLWQRIVWVFTGVKV